MQCEESEGDRKIATDGDALDEYVRVVQLLQTGWLESTRVPVDQSCDIDCHHEKALSFLKLGQRPG